MDDLTREQFTSPWWTTKPPPEPMTPTLYLMQRQAADLADGLHPCPECGGVDSHVSTEEGACLVETSEVWQEYQEREGEA